MPAVIMVPPGHDILGFQGPLQFIVKALLHWSQQFASHAMQLSTCASHVTEQCGATVPMQA